MCNVPVIKAKICSKCQGQTVSVQITAPGDFRMAFPGDIQRLQQVVDADFGLGFGALLIPTDKIVVLNKVPVLDLAEEVIVDGQILGLLVFDPVTDEFHFSAKYSGGFAFLQLAMRSRCRYLSAFIMPWMVFPSFAGEKHRSPRHSIAEHGPANKGTVPPHM